MVNIKEKLEEMVEKLVKEVSPEKVILFGSSRDFLLGEDSDVDLLVVWRTDLPHTKRYPNISHLFNPRPFPMDILIFTPDEVRKRCGWTNSVVREAVETGRVIYERNDR